AAGREQRPSRRQPPGELRDAARAAHGRDERDEHDQRRREPGVRHDDDQPGDDRTSRGHVARAERDHARRPDHAPCEPGLTAVSAHVTPPLGVHTIKAGPQPDRYRGDVPTQVIALNGGSSSGKSGIARCLQAILPDPWLAFGTDNLIQAMPMSLQTSAAGIEFGQDGEVIVGPQFRTLEAAWIAGIAAMAAAGARIIVDEVFVGGVASQLRWKNALGTLRTL